MQTFESVYGNISLQRLPVPPRGQKDSLRAWDAADELILSYLDEQDLLTHQDQKSNNILLFNDAFGALTIALNLHNNESHIESCSDSYLSHLAIDHNLALNSLKPNHVAISSTETLTQQYDVVLIKAPKTLALLEHQLVQLKPRITESTVIIAAGMAKHIHTSTLKIFEKIIGTTTTSQATKKARLIFAKNDQKDIFTSPYPKSFTDEELNLVLSNHANVFSKDHLDIGARFMIEHLKQCPPSQHIIDLGCGNGVLGIMMKRIQPNAQIDFIDESYMAIDSARSNYVKNSCDTSEPSDNDHNNSYDAGFYVGDCFNDISNKHSSSPIESPVDLIVCNPPFHQAHTIGDLIAWKMLIQSRNHLKKGGELWVVGNRHLGYHVKLKKVFGNCHTVASNKKFVILSAKRESD